MCSSSKGRSELQTACWPDGTPKQFQDPKENWKNWINWEAPYKDQTDELNRKRQFFFEVDTKGRLWRKEFHDLSVRHGEMKDARILDFFFGHVQRNLTGSFEDTFPWVSYRVHEQYFLRCAPPSSGQDAPEDIAATGAPVVFNDLRDGLLTYLCPQGETATSISTLFDPSKLRLSRDMCLYHPLRTKALVEDLPGLPRRYEREVVPARIDTLTAQTILDSATETAGDDDPSEGGSKLGGCVSLWGGRWDCTGGGRSGIFVSGPNHAPVPLMILGAWQSHHLIR